MTVRLGTRSSKLAVWQTDFVAERLRRAAKGVECRVVHISTHGDEDRERPLPEIGGKGLFTEKIEEALRDNRIDMAVHSLKDLPVDDSPGLVIAAVLGREEARDVVVSRDGRGLSALRAGAVVGTSSTRREAQLRAARPDLVVKPIRGNVETRIAKVDTGEYDATVIAGAGVMRLGLAGRVSEWISMDQCMPSPGQGALAVQCRSDDQVMLGLLALIDDPALHRATDAERGFLGRLGGGCAAPVAAYAEPVEGAPGSIFLRGRVVSLDGCALVEVEGQGTDPPELARRLADEATSRGAGAILMRARKPLTGKRVLVTRAPDQADDLLELLCARGAVPVALPLIRIEPAGDAGRIQAAVESLSSYDWVVFTSVNGVEHFSGHLDGRALRHKTAAVGPATAFALKARGLAPALVSSEHTGAALARALVAAEGADISSRRILFPCAVDHGEETARVLRGAGAAVDELPVYRTVAADPGAAELAALDGGLDAALFLSGSAVRAFAALARSLSGVMVGCIGPSTAEAARQAGMKVDVVPGEHTAEALVNALEERFGSWTK
ncbi:MAG: hydroxymethylbilane synthase [Spirochaetia bacterium]